MLLDPGSGCASPLSIDGVAFGGSIRSTSRFSTVQVGQTVLDRYKGEEVEIDTAGYRTKIATILRTADVTSESAKTEKESILDQIPTTYHQYWEVFSEQASYRFPPEREEDHAIVLKEGAPDKIDCKIYRQTVEELEATRQFITESLAKGYITDSKSPYASALFYRKKKDGKLRPIMDYQILNKWTVRDNYPLPLITNIIERLQGKTLFSKFDI